jgi:hypothetical protein
VTRERGPQRRPPSSDGPFAETNDLIAGWVVVDFDTWRVLAPKELRARRAGDRWQCGVAEGLDIGREIVARHSGHIEAKR